MVPANGFFGSPGCQDVFQGGELLPRDAEVKQQQRAYEHQQWQVQDPRNDIDSVGLGAEGA